MPNTVCKASSGDIRHEVQIFSFVVWIILIVTIPDRVPLQLAIADIRLSIEFQLVVVELSHLKYRK